MQTTSFNRMRLSSLAHLHRRLGAQLALSSAGQLPLHQKRYLQSQRATHTTTEPLISMAEQEPGTLAPISDKDAEIDALRKQVQQLQVAIQEKEAERNGLVYPYAKSYGKTSLSTIVGRADGGKGLIGTTLCVGGWVKTGREAGAGAFAFLELNDGTAFDSIQVMMPKEVAEPVGGLKLLTPTGTAVLVEGELAATPEGTKQPVELKACKVLHVGQCEAATYPIAKKKITFEFLREKAHLRPRTNTVGAVARIRNALAYATHRFFQDQGFMYVHTPVITASDCEGAGEMFQVTTLLGKVRSNEAAGQPPSAAELEGLKAKVSEQGGRVKEAKMAAAANKEDAGLAAAIKEEVAKLAKAKDACAKAEEAARMVGGLKRTANGDINFHEDFFSRPAYLTVSGQLQGEYYASALSNIYTFGPTFRAENSFTARHLAEFWMIEPEIAFCNLQDSMQCAEDYVRYCCQFLLQNVRRDLEFMNKMIDSTAIARLETVASSRFGRCSYTEAIDILKKAIVGGKKFENPVRALHVVQPEVEWGIDLATEHERFLAEETFKQPVIVYNYPKDIKSFYMKLNDDGKTVAAMDVLVPKVGELIGGSQREDRYDVLLARMAELKMDPAPYEAYLDIRKYGSVPHSGFGLGFERLILFATGLDNIREVIPFPRWPGHAEF